MIANELINVSERHLVDVLLRWLRQTSQRHLLKISSWLDLLNFQKKVPFTIIYLLLEFVSKCCVLIFSHKVVTTLIVLRIVSWDWVFLIMGQIWLFRALNLPRNKKKGFQAWKLLFRENFKSINVTKIAIKRIFGHVLTPLPLNHHNFYENYKDNNSMEGLDVAMYLSSFFLVIW